MSWVYCDPKSRTRILFTGRLYHPPPGVSRENSGSILPRDTSGSRGPFSRPAADGTTRRPVPDGGEFGRKAVGRRSSRGERPGERGRIRLRSQRRPGGSGPTRDRSVHTASPGRHDITRVFSIPERAEVRYAIMTGNPPRRKPCLGKNWLGILHRDRKSSSSSSTDWAACRSTAGPNWRRRRRRISTGWRNGGAAASPIRSSWASRPEAARPIWPYSATIRSATSSAAAFSKRWARTSKSARAISSPGAISRP